jgi:predicted DsbA family dithiol-disulfide isomerase
MTFEPPKLVPWSRKAHELHLLARAHAVHDPVREAVFDAYFRDGRDIGRVDVLVDLASRLGLGRTEIKPALDVDRYQADVVDARRRAREEGVADVPSFRAHGTLPEGFPRLEDLGTLLPDP